MSDKDATLDLGLGQLLTEHEDAAAHGTPSPCSGDQEPGPASQSQPLIGGGNSPLPSRPADRTVIQPPPHELTPLATSGRWSELLARAEEILSTTGDEDFLARVYWIRAQLELNALPALILVAPVEEVLSKVSNVSGSEQRFTAQITVQLLKDLCSRLEQDGDSVTAVELLGRASQILPDLRPAYTTAATREHARLSASVEALHDEGVKAQIAQLSSVILAPDTADPESSGSESSPGRAPLSTLDPTPRLNANSVPLSSALLSSALRAAALKVPIRTRQYLRPIGLAALLLALLGAYYIWSIRGDSILESAIPVVELPTQAALRLPALAETVGLNELNAVMYDLERKGSARAATVQRTSGVDLPDATPFSVPSTGQRADHVGPSGKSDLAMESAAGEARGEVREPRQEGISATAGQAPAPSAREKQQLDLNGPTESQALRRLREQGPTDEDSGPESGSRTDGPTPVPLFPEGRPAPASRADSFDLPEVRAVEIYRVIISTPVREGPSFSAPILADLAEGARVRASGRAGSWLRISSRSGRPGFVFRDDVEFLERSPHS